MRSTFLLRNPLPCLGLGLALALPPAAPAADDAPGLPPVDAQGRRLNLDFETGTLADWTASGDAFTGQPIEGDTVSKRRGDMKSGHQGRFWIGTYERAGDAPRGTLTSAPFPVAHRWASFLVSGGPGLGTRVEIVRADTNIVEHTAYGDESEQLKREVVDLARHVGKPIFLRLVDDASGGWGHINFDDFRFHPDKPDFPGRKAPPPPDAYTHNGGLSGEEAARAMTVPPGFQVTLAAAEPDVVRPIAFTIDHRGRVWVAENHSYPFKVKPEDARDRILILEDTDGDGRLDSRKVFHEGLSMITGLEVGFGGVWVGAAPELVFIPDANGDDTPDSAPQVLLDGWGLQDTHETLNSFLWGPDGWLYGCHGVFTHSKVGKPGTPDSERIPLNAGIWRYHPTKHRFEVFSQGTSNPWGLDFDDRGQAFIEACVIPHLYHMIQGGRYERQAGQHFNPYTYDDIKTIADHRHYLGATPHSGNNRSDAAGGGHAHSGLAICLTDTWPAEYRNSLLMNNIHGARLNRDLVEPAGSGYIGRHAPDFLRANDRASQVIALRYGPDGALWMIDWYDLQQCHVPNATVHQKTKGRVFKVLPPGAKWARVDLATLTDLELARLQLSQNDWQVRTARRLLQERAAAGKLDPAVRPQLEEWASQEDDIRGRLRALWALHVTGNLDEQNIRPYLTEQGELRGWTFQLALEDRKPSERTLAILNEAAATDATPFNQLYIASAAQRLPLAQRWPIVEGLAPRINPNDPNLPLMVWYALEPLVADDPSRALAIAARASSTRLLEFATRRAAAIGTDAAIASVVQSFRLIESKERLRLAMRALVDSLAGRRKVDMPADWAPLATQLLNGDDADLRSLALSLGLTFGDQSAMGILRNLLADASAQEPERINALQSLLKAQDRAMVKPLLGILTEPDRPALRAEAFKALAAFDAPEIPAAILAAYPKLPLAEKTRARGALAARASSAATLLDAVESGSFPRADLTADVVRQMRNLNDEDLRKRLEIIWGRARETSADRAQVIAHYKADLAKDAAKPVDLSRGRAVFARICQQCHALFGTGSNVGPDLTGSNRADLDYILSNVLDPSSLIGKDYQALAVATTDGRVLTGLVRAETGDTLTLVTATETITLPKSDIEERKISEQSMMPDDLLQPLSWDEKRSLFAYLASPGQVPLLATPETAPLIFDGKSLAGWSGDPDLWFVESGEIVGRSPGLKANSFLIGDLAADDFELTLQVKLTPNSENSGIQFRSAPHGEGHVKGYQADAGAGWWGKLYEEDGRGLLWDQSGESHVKPGEWNHYRIRAVGPRIKTWINGQPCVALDDPPGARRGIFALQIHAGGPMEVRFKDLKLQLLTPDGAPR